MISALPVSDLGTSETPLIGRSGDDVTIGGRRVRSTDLSDCQTMAHMAQVTGQALFEAYVSLYSVK